MKKYYNEMNLYEKHDKKLKVYQRWNSFLIGISITFEILAGAILIMYFIGRFAIHEEALGHPAYIFAALETPEQIAGINLHNVFKNN